MSPRPGAPRFVTMRDVASLAGVGVKTVSRALNGEPNVSPATAERVNRAAAALNYEINVYAGGLRRSGSRTKTLGLLLESVDNPFSGAVHRGVETIMRPHGIAVLAASYDEDPDSEQGIVTGFLQRRVDGLILMSASRTHGYLSDEVSRGTPIVFVDRPAVGIAFDSVVSSNYEGAVGATRHLLERGHRRLAYVGSDPRIATLGERRRGFADELDRWRVPARQATYVEDLHDPESARIAVRKLLEGPEAPTAIFAAQNLVALGSVRALHECGKQHKIAFVGFDDVTLLDLLNPGVTVVAQNPHRLGELAAERVLARMNGEVLEMETITVPTTLIERGSGEIPALTPAVLTPDVRRS